MQEEIAAVNRFSEMAMEFVVAYGFQILGALVFLFVGLKVSAWLAARTQALLDRRNVDRTLARFAASAVQVVLVVFLLIATLGKFGVSIAPLIAMAGAAAFGASVALQGPLSNYAAGVSIILSRPFVIGDTIAVRDVSGVVQDIKLAATILVGEDGERITIPNRQIVGQILVNSDASRIVESRNIMSHNADAEAAMAALRAAVARVPDVASERPPQVGIEDFAYAGLVIGLRYWVPSRKYFATRFAVNVAVREALVRARISLVPSGQLAVVEAVEARPASVQAGTASGGDGLDRAI